MHRIDFDQAHRVASAFLDAPRATTDRITRAAYASLGVQAERWFARLTGGWRDGSVRVVYTLHPEPYSSADELANQVRSDRVLEIRPTKYDRDRRHPLLDASVGGTYDKLRAVHDIVSHAWLGYGFDRDGEYSAWLNEDRMYTGLARWALATELHAEHSVLWTTGELADHKATLLPADILATSRGSAPGMGTGDLTRGSHGGESRRAAFNVSFIALRPVATQERSNHAGRISRRRIERYPGQRSR